MEFLLDGIRAVTPQQCVMYVVGALLIYLAIKKDYEPSLLLPMGFGSLKRRSKRARRCRCCCSSASAR